MRHAFGVLVIVILASCGDGLLKPSGADGSAPPLPTGTNFLDARLANCPTTAELNSVADHKITFDTSVTSLPLVCHESEGSRDLTYPQLRVYWGLILLKELRFDAPVPWTAKPLYDWVRDTVNGVRVYAGDGTSNYQQGANTVALYVNASSSQPLKWPTLQQFIGLLLHEVRHAEVGGHVCSGRYDNKVSDLHAFGVQNTFFTWIGEHSNPAVIPIEYRPHALHTACTHRGSAFCQEPHQTCR